MATKPDNMPLHIIVGSGFMPFAYNVKHRGDRAGNARQHGVDHDRADPQVGAGQVEPGLKPNQPKARMNVPTTTIGT